MAVSATGAYHVAGTPANMAHITLFFQSSCVAHVNVNWLSPVKIRQTLIGGSRKMIVYDDLEATEKIKVYDKGITVRRAEEDAHQFRIGYRAGDMWAPHLSVKEALQTEAEHFIDCVRTGASPISNGATGLQVVETVGSGDPFHRRTGQTGLLARQAETPRNGVIVLSPTRKTRSALRRPGRPRRAAKRWVHREVPRKARGKTAAMVNTEVGVWTATLPISEDALYFKSCLNADLACLST